ncbi:MAG: N-acetyl-gamma-glutamyl-phosphate reductase [Spirochaetales bacterium]|nr:N-acetyl-gamma-glutamyl-phosphate reductase [Spirochaetales bacterium]
MKTAILGTSGYTGQVLLRLLLAHPGVTQIIPVSSSKKGEAITAFDAGISEKELEKLKATQGTCVDIQEAYKQKFDVVFAALPHLKSAELCAPFLGKAVVIDLSADFRIKDSGLFEKAYGARPPREDLLDQAVYGLCEWYHEEIKKTDLIANPGCYTTASLLPLLPLVKEGLAAGPLMVNAISGISGAGKKSKEYLLYCERSENLWAYSPGKTHRHSFEIQAELAKVDPKADLFFTPHLAPLMRGIATTITVQLAEELSQEQVVAVYENYYGSCPFIGLRKTGIPQTKEVWGSNRCDIGFYVQGTMLYLFSVLDNLIKGASGQAVQNMNIRFGMEETAGLPVHSVL